VYFLIILLRTPKKLSYGETPSMNKLYIIIPAYNEEENIETVVREWHDVVVKVNKHSRIAVIDDGSKDSTYIKLKELQKELSQLEAITKPNSGHGATILYGYRHALVEGADYVFQTDSDGQTLPSEFWQFWEDRGKYDIQIGFRKGRQDGFSRIIVTKTLKLILFLQFGIWITDANTPFRLMSLKTLSEMLRRIPENHNLSNVLLTVLYHKEKKKVNYYPITFRPRQGGTNSINLSKIIKIGWKAIKDFASLRSSL
jgi:glycosyltransferase involved in cell wall biosynthesis